MGNSSGFSDRYRGDTKHRKRRSHSRSTSRQKIASTGGSHSRSTSRRQMKEDAQEVAPRWDTVSELQSGREGGGGGGGTTMPLEPETAVFQRGYGERPPAPENAAASQANGQELKNSFDAASVAQ